MKLQICPKGGVIGYEPIEGFITTSYEHHMVKETPEEAMDHVLKVIMSHKDLEIVTIHAPDAYWTLRDVQNDTRAQDLIKACTKLCEVLKSYESDNKIKRVQLLFHIAELDKPMIEWHKIEKFFEEYLETELGYLVIENITRLITKADTVDKAIAYVGEINNPKVGYCLDTCHAEIDTYLYCGMHPGVVPEEVREVLFPHELVNKHLMNVHFSKTQGNGFGWNHSMPCRYPEEVKDIVVKYRSINLDKVPIVCEVVEPVYADRDWEIEHIHAIEAYNKRG